MHGLCLIDDEDAPREFERVSVGRAPELPNLLDQNKSGERLDHLDVEIGETLRAPCRVLYVSSDRQITAGRVKHLLGSLAWGTLSAKIVSQALAVERFREHHRQGLLPHTLRPSKQQPVKHSSGREKVTYCRNRFGVTDEGIETHGFW
jgi:hypothetical protein